VRHGATLQTLLEAEGYLALRRMEEEVLLEMPLDRTLVATGGSAVYSAPAMARLHAAGPVVFIDVPLTVLRERVASAPDRGIACPAGQDLGDVFREREPLYRAHADITVSGVQESADALAHLLAVRLTAA